MCTVKAHTRNGRRVRSHSRKTKRGYAGGSIGYTKQEYEDDKRAGAMRKASKGSGRPGYKNFKGRTGISNM